MKLILAVVNNDDSAVVTSALTKEGFFVTKLTTTGGFLMVGNTTLLIGTEDDQIDNIKTILRRYCSTRKQINPSSSSFGKSLDNQGIAEEVTVGGATFFVLSVDSYEKL
ncbi:MAG: transcriptional regulator [Clostridiales bacterium GWF2_38_85]|nr:MAG: transcriptional regulator [Clostridiales bacterium GWF2_38_85]HBL84631.1 transcriptional regulator [Clostridiales bacterium]